MLPNVKHHRADGDDSPLETGPALAPVHAIVRQRPASPRESDATPVREFNRMKQMCEYAGEDIMELYFFLLFR